jgi:chromate reductase
MKLKIAVLVGSLRKESWNRKIALEAIKLAPESLELKIIEIGQLPLYNQDFDDHPPKEWTDFREEIKKFDGLLFVTPEYNRSVPACLKNAIDVGSRPYGKSVWDNKPGAIISASIGAISGFGANHHLRQSLVFVNIPCMQQPEAYIGNVTNSFDTANNSFNESTQKFLEKYMQAYEKWVKTILGN